MGQNPSHNENSSPTIRVGTDIVSVERISKSIERESFIQKVFHPSEIQYCQKKSNPAPSFAARFAAKEAFLKALGTGLYARGMGPLDIWIENEDNGRPRLVLSLEAHNQLATLGVCEGWDVSLSHDAQLALATVVIRFKSA